MTVSQGGSVVVVWQRDSDGEKLITGMVAFVESNKGKWH